MTPEEQRIVDEVTGVLVGRVVPLRGRPFAIHKGEIFREIVDTTPPDVDPFDAYTCKGVNLRAHKTGVITGVVYAGNEPVGLEIK